MVINASPKLKDMRRGSKDVDRSKEADGARWGWGWGISPGKTHMKKYLVLGEPKRLEARTVKVFIGWLGLPNQPLPQF